MVLGVILDWIFRRWPKPAVAVVFTVVVVLWLLERRAEARRRPWPCRQWRDVVADEIVRGLIEDG